MNSSPIPGNPPRAIEEPDGEERVVKEKVMWPRLSRLFRECTDDFFRGIGISCLDLDPTKKGATEKLLQRVINYLRGIVGNTVSEEMDKKAYEKAYMPSARSQHKRRIAARIVSLAWFISVGDHRPSSKCSERYVRNACEHLVAELAMFQAVVPNLPRWLRLSTPFTFLFIRLCAIDCHVKWQNIISHEGLGTCNPPELVDSYRADNFNIFHLVRDVKKRVRAQLRIIRLQFLHNGDISIDAYDPAAVEARQLGDASICLDDIDHEVDRVGDLVLAMNEVVPLVCVVDQPFSERLASLWRSEGGSSNKWRWKGPDKKELRPFVLYEHGDAMDVFHHMMRSIQCCEAKHSEAKADAETELSSLAVVSHMCREIAQSKPKELSVYGYKREKGKNSVDIRNVPLQNMVYGVWKSAVHANGRVHEALSSYFGVGKEDLRSAIGFLDTTYWTGPEVQKRDSPRFNIEKDVISTFFFMSLIFEDQQSSVREASAIYSNRMARSSETREFA